MELGLVLPDFPGVAAINQEYGLGRLCDPLNVPAITSAMTDVLAMPRAEWRTRTRRFLANAPSPEAKYRDVQAALAEG